MSKLLLLCFMINYHLYANECRKHYEAKIESKIERHEGISKSFYVTGTAAAIFAFINPIVSGVILGAHFGATLLSSRYGSSSGNIFNLQMMDTPDGEKLFKKIVEINNDLTNVDISCCRRRI